MYAKISQSNDLSLCHCMLGIYFSKLKIMQHYNLPKTLIHISFVVSF